MFHPDYIYLGNQGPLGGLLAWSLAYREVCALTSRKKRSDFLAAKICPPPTSSIYLPDAPKISQMSFSIDNNMASNEIKFIVVFWIDFFLSYRLLSISQSPMKLRLREIY